MYKSVKLIIAGGRDFDDYPLLQRTVDEFIIDNKMDPADILIISGDAEGADKMGERYGDENGIKVKRMPADWDELGEAAGFHRNKSMAKIGTHLIAFHDGQSSGTASMIELGKKYRLQTTVVCYTKEEN